MSDVPRSSGIAAVVVVGVVVSAAFVLPLALVMFISGSPGIGGTCSQGVPSIQGPAGPLDADQTSSTISIVAVVQHRELPQRAAVLAVSTAYGESQLRNSNAGNERAPDARGLFQQRPIFHPGVDPMLSDQATSAFLDGLVQVPQWETAPNAALIVQYADRGGSLAGVGDVGTLPNPYAAFESFAQSAVATLWELQCSAEAAPGAVGGQAFPLALNWWSEHPNWFGRPHHNYPAADIPVPQGTTVYAVEGGSVIGSPVGGSCGQGVMIQSDDGIQWGYCHGVTPLVPYGARVEAGMPIMVSGNTGHSTGAHLHLQIRLPSGIPVCPQTGLVAWANGQAVNVAELPRQGCVG